MVGRLSECYLLAYRTDPADVRPLLPKGLEPITKDGSAFWNLVVSKVDKMRPKGLPRWLGSSYIHIAYRIYVRAKTTDGPVEGLYFVRSDADKRMIVWAGNVMTDFRFHRSSVRWSQDEKILDVRAVGKSKEAAEAHVRLDLTPSPDLEPMPSHLKYAPYGLSCNRESTRLKVAEVLRDEGNWSERPIRVLRDDWSLFEALGQRDVQFVGASVVAPIDYRWRIGKRISRQP